MEGVAALLQRQESFAFFVQQSTNRVVESKRNDYSLVAIWINANFASRSGAVVRQMLEQAQAIVNASVGMQDLITMGELRVLIESYAQPRWRNFDADDLQMFCGALLACMKHRNFTWFVRGPQNTTNTVNIILEACRIFNSPLFDEHPLQPSVKLLDKSSYLLSEKYIEDFHKISKIKSYKDGIDLEEYDFKQPFVIEITGINSENNLVAKLCSYGILLVWMESSDRSCFTRNKYRIFDPEKDQLVKIKESESILITPDQLVKYLAKYKSLQVVITN